MTPTDFPEATKTFAVQRGRVRIPVAETEGVVFTIWTPSDEEREAIAAGAPIEVALASNGKMCPMMVAVYGESGFFQRKRKPKLIVEVDDWPLRH